MATDLSDKFDRLPHELEPVGAVQGDLFTPAGKGTATLLRTLPQGEGRVYELDPPLNNRWSRILIDTGHAATYVRAWENPGAGPFIADPMTGASTHADALDRLGYELGNALSPAWAAASALVS